MDTKQHFYIIKVYYDTKVRFWNALVIDIKSKIIYNLPYYPEFNPIEYFFNTLKKEVRKINLSKTNNIDKLSELLDT
jgi:hypothetical protein